MKRVRRFFDRLFRITPSQPEDTSGAIRILQLESINAQLLQAARAAKNEIDQWRLAFPATTGDNWLVSEQLERAIYAATEE